MTSLIVNHLDLDIAIAESIVSRDQAVRLRDLSMRSAGPDSAYIDFSQDTRDEPFRLLRGFRDVFISIGVAIFAFGISAIALPFIGKFTFSNGLRFDSGSVLTLLIALGLCIFGLAQAELITRKYRLPLSSLVAAIAFALWSAYLAGTISSILLASVYSDAVQNLRAARLIVGWAPLAGGIFGTVIFYWRYRLPSALLLLAGSIVGLSLTIVSNVMGNQWFGDHARILIGLWGSAIFVSAMWFDIKDRLRVTRFSECAFWLHLFAAPMLVHAMLFGDPLGAPKLVFVLATMGVLAAIALVIDRRALLVSGLGYFAVAISQLVSNSTFFGGHEIAMTAFILGGVVLTLGLGWTPIRRGALAVLPFESLKSRLPPAAP
jgi:hypothetical protein